MANKADKPVPLIEIVTLDTQRRIDIDADVLESSLGVKLSPHESANLWALVGSKGQLQLLPLENEIAKIRERYVDKKPDLHLPWDASSLPAADAMRKFSNMFRIKCNCEPARSKLRLTIPSDAIEQEYAKDCGELIVFVSGEIFELWQIDAWRENSAVVDTKAFTKQIKKALGS